MDGESVGELVRAGRARLSPAARLRLEALGMAQDGDACTYELER